MPLADWETVEYRLGNQAVGVGQSWGRKMQMGLGWVLQQLVWSARLVGFHTAVALSLDSQPSAGESHFVAHAIASHRHRRLEAAALVQLSYSQKYHRESSLPVFKRIAICSRLVC
jgi:hypothetical protein